MVATITTADGLDVPALGFGTYGLRGADAYDCVQVALDAGYRHLDTAQNYDNEEAVGRAIADSPVDRDEIFVTTKISREHAAPVDVIRTAADSLRRLELDRVDLLLLHWPAEDIVPMEATLEAMAALRDQQLTRAIGVSNFTAAQLERAFDVAPIVTDQVEHHPYLSANMLREVLDRRGGFLTAYCPLARGNVLDDPTLREIAGDHDVSPAQVTLRWFLQRGVSPIPRSSSEERIRANADVYDFALTDDEIARIDGLARGERLIDPGFAPAWDPA